MSTFVRVDVWSLAADHPIITAYGDAVAAMKAKPAHDPTSWTYQAAIHGSLAAHPPAGWNQCRHGSWYFVSWHRAYLYYFERIVRAQVIANGGSHHWALPYWNYDGGSGHNAIPLGFRSPTRTGGGANPLYVQDRAAGINAGAGLPASITTSSFALSRPTFTGASEFGGGSTSPLNHFFSATGRLEQTPHNDVHVAMGGLMGDPSTAAEDPIFWLHHANIDRLWWLWQKHHHSSANPHWTGQSFDFFDVAGAAASKTAAQVLHIVPQLDYTYDHKLVPAPKPPAPKAFQAVAWPGPWPPRQEVAQSDALAAQSGEEMVRHLVGASEQPVQLVGEITKVPVAIDARAAQGIQADARTPLEHRAFLDLDDVEAERNPGTVYGVYVNLPDAPTDDDLDEHHVGNLSLFGVERARTPRGDEHAHGLHTSMDITDLLDRLAALGQWTDGTALDVTFRPIGLEPPEGAGADAVPSTAHPEQPITVGRVSVHFA